jgi:DNA-binding transcriptional MerR regulator
MKDKNKLYNVFETASLVGVHERTIRYWVKRGWIRPRRDYRRYPVFTKGDIDDIIKWRSTLQQNEGSIIHKGLNGGSGN